MNRTPYPRNEAERRAALRSYHILDTKPEEDYDFLVRAAANICDTPIALISLVDGDRQWLKAKVGTEVTQTPRDLAFCAHAIMKPESTMMVNNALEDERFAKNPLVLDDPNIRFYAGAPLMNDDGYALGTLCVIDKQPRTLTGEQSMMLRTIAASVMQLLEKKKIEMCVEKKHRCLQMMERMTDLGHWELNMDESSMMWSDGLFDVHGLKPDAYRPCKDSITAFYHPDDRPRIDVALRAAFTKGIPFDMEARLMKMDGEVRKVRTCCECDVDEAGRLRSILGTMMDMGKVE